MNDDVQEAKIADLESSYSLLTNISLALLIVAGVVGLASGVVSVLANLKGGELIRAKDHQLARDLADKDKEIAIAKKDAALAKQVAERERLERVRLEAQVAPRRLNQEAILEIATDLANFARHKVKVSSHTGDVEAAILGAQIIDALQRAKIDPFDRRMTNQSFGAVAVGLLISGTDTALVKAIAAAFSKHLNVAQGSPPQGQTTIIPAGEDDVPTEATIFIGVKPLPP